MQLASVIGVTPHRWAKGPDASHDAQAALPFVSVIVPAYNEEYLLADCVAALQRQDYAGRYEIIVVNNASTDRTPNIAREMGVRVVDEPLKGYVNALRAGFGVARGEVLACTDADTLVPSDWVSRLVRALTSQPNVVGVSGAFEFYDGPGWLKLACRLVSRCSWHLSGANMALWRWAYDAVGGVDPAVNLGADVELGMRLRRLGRVVIDCNQVAATSSRRFQVALLPSLCDTWSTISG
jgi:cellulose synthase/poly-beta-1,6-N-acetylglucosamine synthase-like glycosyltransferase